MILHYDVLAAHLLSGIVLAPAKIETSNYEVLVVHSKPIGRADQKMYLLAIRP